jgi:GxxExxY protein
MLLAGDLTERVIGLAITVHRHTGRGLLESVYEQCLCYELEQAGLPFARQVAIPIMYRGMRIGEGFRADIVIGEAVIVEIKAVAALIPAHEAQLHTYLRLSGLRIGLLMNFNESRLVDGLRRLVL